MTTRLKCVFRVENNGKAMGRPANGFIAFGCDRKWMDGESYKKIFYLMLTTRLNKGHPRKIKLTNFHSLFDKMKCNGMATIQFVDPKLALYVTQADPKKLSQFLVHLNGLLSSASSSKRIDGKGAQLSSTACTPSPLLPQMPSCPSIPSVSTVHRQCTSAIASAKPTKLFIDSTHQYHSMIRQGSANLQCLAIVGIGFRTVDIRWFGMRCLQQLSLADNKLGSDDWCTERNWRLFSAISKLDQLNTLDLSQNEFIYLHEMFIDALPVSLVHLNLASNRLMRLSNRISRLQKLRTLRLDQNPLDELPEDLCLIANLRELSLVGLKQLQFLPAFICTVNFSVRRFDLLDLSNNEHAPFITGHRKRNFTDNAVTIPTGTALLPPTLCELAATAVLNNKDLICPNSCLLRSVFADCLPSTLFKCMRHWLHRCAFCNRLFNVALSSGHDAANDEQFKRVDLRRCAISLYGGFPFAFYRVQLCRKCVGRRTF